MYFFNVVHDSEMLKIDVSNEVYRLASPETNNHALGNLPDLLLYELYNIGKTLYEIKSS